MVQFITHYTDQYTYLDSVRIALEGGCRWIQLRMKDTPTEDILPIAKETLTLCRQYEATFIIDDHVELANKSKLMVYTSANSICPSPKHEKYLARISL